MRTRPIVTVNKTGTETTTVEEGSITDETITTIVTGSRDHRTGVIVTLVETS